MYIRYTGRGAETNSVGWTEIFGSSLRWKKRGKNKTASEYYNEPNHDPRTTTPMTWLSRLRSRVPRVLSDSLRLVKSDHTLHDVVSPFTSSSPPRDGRTNPGVSPFRKTFPTTNSLSFSFWLETVSLLFRSSQQPTPGRRGRQHDGQ